MKARIYYDVFHDIHCTTRCPFHMRDRRWAAPFIKLVGSNGCSECENFVSNDRDRHVVECSSHKEDKDD